MGDVYAELFESITGIDPVIEEVEAAPVEATPTAVTNDLNVLNPLIMYEFKNEIIAAENEFLTAPIGTTITMDEFIDGLEFDITDLIKLLTPNEYVVGLRCNFSEPVYYAGYIKPVLPPKTNRGRKKKEPSGKQRKRQGNGKNFNNQITFETRAGEGMPVHKFKVFHTGRIQLPGADQKSIDDVIACTTRITEKLREVTPCGEPLYVRPVMKNYKFRVKIPTGCMLHLSELGEIIKREHNLPSDDAPDHPPIFWLEYVRKRQKINVSFRTPIPDNDGKKTTLAIMASGKINVLGGLYAADTRAIFEFIHWIFRKYGDQVLVGRPKLQHVEERFELLPPPQERIDELNNIDIYHHIVSALTKKHGLIDLSWIATDG